MLIVLSLLLMSAISSEGSEPQCSPYHFVEQTLTKVIQVEMTVQKMKEDLVVTQQKVLDKLQELHNDKSQFQRDIDNEVDTIKKEYNKMNEDNKAQMAEFTAQFEKMKDNLKPVYFMAKDLTTTTPNRGEILIFKTAMMNYGDGYDSSSGIFTAPVNGVYLFALQLCGRSGSSLYYTIKTNDGLVKSGHFYDAASNSCVTTDTVTTLEQGGTAWIAVLRGGKLTQSSDLWNTFSGVLLHSLA